jgi:hypothetical protein
MIQFDWGEPLRGNTPVGAMFFGIEWDNGVVDFEVRSSYRSMAEEYFSDRDMQVTSGQITKQALLMAREDFSAITGVYGPAFEQIKKRIDVIDISFYSDALRRKFYTARQVKREKFKNWREKVMREQEKITVLEKKFARGRTRKLEKIEIWGTTQYRVGSRIHDIYRDAKKSFDYIG